MDAKLYKKEARLLKKAVAADNAMTTEQTAELATNVLMVTASGVTIYAATYAHQGIAAYLPSVLESASEADAIAVGVYVAAHTYPALYTRIAGEIKDGSIVGKAVAFMVDQNINLGEAAEAFSKFGADLQKKMALSGSLPPKTSTKKAKRTATI